MTSVGTSAIMQHSQERSLFAAVHHTVVTTSLEGTGGVDGALLFHGFVAAHDRDQDGLLDAVDLQNLCGTLVPQSTELERLWFQVRELCTKGQPIKTQPLCGAFMASICS
jgi:hypothetical protein